jgi:hypothetical protein
VKKRLLVLGLAAIGGVVALAAQLIATPQQLGVYDNVQFIQPAPQQTKSNCPKSSATVQHNGVRFINDGSSDLRPVEQ